MSYDQQPFQQPNSPQTQTQPDGPAQSGASPQSRRNFLRTAVMSGVAVATIGTSAGVVVEACAPQAGILKRFGIHLGDASGPSHCAMCFENTEYEHISSFKVKNGRAAPPEYFIWLTAHNLAPGSYTMSVSPDPTNSSSPFKLASSGNNAFLFSLDANKATDCPSCDTKGYVQMNCATCAPKSPVRQNHSPDGLFATAYTTGGGNHDLQMQIHIKWDGTKISSNHTYTFTGTVKNAQGAVVCTATATVTAKKDS